MPIPPQEHIANGYEVRAERCAASMKITIRLFITSKGNDVRERVVYHARIELATFGLKIRCSAN